MWVTIVWLGLSEGSLVVGPAFLVFEQQKMEGNGKFFQVSRKYHTMGQTKEEANQTMLHKET